MGSGLLGGAEGGGAEHELERALVDAGTAGAAERILQPAGLAGGDADSPTGRIQHALEADGLSPRRRIQLTRELATLHALAGRFDRAFPALALALSLAEDANDLAETCELEVWGAYYAVQIGAFESAHDLLDNAEVHAVHVGDERRLGIAHVVRGVVSLAVDAVDDAVELIADGVWRVGETDLADRRFALRQQARALARAGCRDAATWPLGVAIPCATQRGDPTGLADCLDTFAALSSDEHGARALGAARALRVLGRSVRWADERDEAHATLAAVRASIGYDRAAELGSAGGGDPWDVAREAARQLDR